MIIDFHAHVLPGLDHGCKDIITSLRQICMAKEAGVDIIAATSHYYPNVDMLGDFLACRQKSWELLNAVLPEDAPLIIPAAEVLIYDGIDKMDGLLNLCFSGLPTILLEMPSCEWTAATYDTIEKINDLTGGCAVIAHVNRYDPVSIDRLFEIGVTGQVSTESLMNHNSFDKLLDWIDSGKISALGSEIHGTCNAYANFMKAKEILGYRYERIMTRSQDLLCSDKRVFIR